MSRSPQITTKHVFSIMLAFLLSMFLFLLTCIFVVQSTVLSETYMRTKMNDSNYYQLLSDEIEEQLVSYGSASGFTQDFFNNVVDKATIHKDVNTITGQLYGENITPLDTAAFSQKLHERFISNAKERNITITPEIEQAVTLLTQTCVDSYTELVGVPYISQIAPMIQKLQQPIKILSTVLAVVVFLLITILFFMQRWKHRSVRCYIYALSGTILMILSLPAIVFLSGKISKIAISSASLYHLAVAYMTGILLNFLIAAICMIIFLFVLAVLYHKMKSFVEK